MKRNIGFAAVTLLIALSGSIARAEKVVMIGDSITCGPFGDRMLKNLESNGQNNVTVYCMVGSTPTHWLRGKKASGACQIRTSQSPKMKPCSTQAPTLASILSQNSGAHIVVALGTNSTPGTNLEGSYKEMAAAIKSANRSCDWVLPPHMNPAQSKRWPPGHVRKMETNLPGIIRQINTAVNTAPATACHTVDSRDATAAGTPGIGTTDGVHRTTAASDYWADEIKGKLLRSQASGSTSTGKSSRPSAQ